MTRKVLYKHILDQPENKDIQRLYKTWSNAYEKIYAELPARQQRELEILYGKFNDLCYEIEHQAYAKGMFNAFDFIIARFPELKEKIKEVEADVSY